MGAKGGVNIGNAWMNVSAQFGSVPKDLSNALNGAADSANAKGIGSGIGDKLGLGIVSKVAGLGTAIAGAIGFVNVAKEALAASDATDKFKSTLNFAGLDTSKIDALTKSTQKYADETVYDLSDIQNVTAQLAANGVKDFDKLGEAAGNLNAVSGGNKDTFKLVALALTQVNGAGKLVTQDWNQIASAIPGASGKLQDAMRENGAFTGNFRDAMAKGEITAAEFNQALMDLGMTDVAKEAATSTSTMEGAWGNFQATLVGGFKSVIDTVKPGITGALSWASDKLGGFFDWTGGAVQGLVALIGQGNFTSAFRDAFNVEEDSPAVTVILKIRDAAIGLYNLVVNGDFSSALRNAFNVEEDSPLVTIFLSARDAVIDFATSIPDKLGAAFSWVQSNWDWLSPVAVAIGAAVGAFKLWTGAIALWQTATEIATGVQVAFNAVMAANPIMLVVMAVAALVAGLVYFFTQTETGRQVWASFTSWLSGVWESVSSAWTTAWNAITNFLSSLWNGIKDTAADMWNGLISWVTGIPGRFMAGLAALGQLAAQFAAWVGGAKDAAVNKFWELVNWVGGIPGRILGALGNLGSLLWNAGSQIIAGLWDGLRSKFESVKSWVGGIGDWIAAHKGPKAYDLKLLVPNGGWIMDGLNRGLTSGFGDVLGNVSGMAAQIRGEIDGATINAATGLSLAAAVPAYKAGNVSPTYSANDDLVTRLDDEQVERLARAFETGSKRAAIRVGQSRNR
ncbi:MAG: tape measure protein [Acidipropionibacterium jensenii]|nr:tape measure protein [Acidipropionibacterium jensenii]